jgi:sulfatase maturation enzyme AslB (radical SAM superfamily)
VDQGDHFLKAFESDHAVISFKSLFSFRAIEIGISVDGPPEVNEYIRYPIKSEKLLANIRKLDNSKVNAIFWLSTTVQIYNVLYLEALETWLNEQKFQKISPIAWHVLRRPASFQ